MILVKPKVEVFAMPQTLDLRHIEYCGKVAYKSEERITDGSALIFVKDLLNKGHFSVLRHLGLRTDRDFSMAPDSDYIWRDKGWWYGNLQAWMEVAVWNYEVSHELALAFEKLFGEAKSNQCNFNETSFQVDPYWQTVRFTCDRGVSHELVRHTTMAVTQESTRYCNYKGGVTFVIPPYAIIEEGEYNYPLWSETNYTPQESLFIVDCLNSESQYKLALELGLKPQLARGYLNHMVKTEVVMSGSLSHPRHWKHFIDVRYHEETGKVHPQMMELTKELYGNKMFNLQ